MAVAATVERFQLTVREPAVSGFLHRPAAEILGAVVLTHGAGANANAPLLVAVANTLADAGYAVLRCDLPFRQKRPTGPPLGSGKEDREGLRNAVLAMREVAAAPVFLAGHSYGGRQASMLAADDSTVAKALLLLSYPLHPPRKPEQLRTAHFPALHTAALFVHGARDPFGSEEEMRAALALIPARTQLLMVEGAGHELARTEKNRDVLAERISHAFQEFVRS
jgi:predicted alpha/beta-hydrolase family hydrolase